MNRSVEVSVPHDAQSWGSFASALPSSYVEVACTVWKYVTTYSLEVGGRAAFFHLHRRCRVSYTLIVGAGDSESLRPLLIEKIFRNVPSDVTANVLLRGFWNALSVMPSVGAQRSLVWL